MELAATARLRADGSYRGQDDPPWEDRTLGYLLWPLVGVVVSRFAASTVGDAKAKPLRRLHDLDAVTAWRHTTSLDGGKEER
jgi:hypothetical protein